MSADAVSAGTFQIPQVYRNLSWNFICREGTHWVGVLWNLANLPVAYTIAKIFAKTIPSPSVVNCWPSLSTVPVPRMFVVSNFLLLTKEICYLLISNQSEAGIETSDSSKVWLKKRSYVISIANILIVAASAYFCFFKQFPPLAAVVPLQLLPHIFNWVHDIVNNESWFPLTDYDLEEQEIVFLKKFLNKKGQQDCNNEKILQYIEGKDCKSKIKILSNALAKLKEAEDLLRDENQDCSSFGLSDELASIPVFKDLAKAVHYVGQYRRAPDNHTRQGIDNLPPPAEDNLKLISMKIKNAQNDDGKGRVLARINTLNRMIVQELIDQLDTYLPEESGWPSNAKNLQFLLCADRVCKIAIIILGVLACFQYLAIESLNYLLIYFAYFAIVCILDLLRRPCMSYYRLSSDVLAGKDQSQTRESAISFHTEAAFRYKLHKKNKELFDVRNEKDQRISDLRNEKDQRIFEMQFDLDKVTYNRDVIAKRYELERYLFPCKSRIESENSNEFVFLAGQEQQNEKRIQEIVLCLLNDPSLAIVIHPKSRKTKVETEIYRGKSFAKKILEVFWKNLIGENAGTLSEQQFQSYYTLSQRLKVSISNSQHPEIERGVTLSVRLHAVTSCDLIILDAQEIQLRSKYPRVDNDNIEDPASLNIKMMHYVIRLCNLREKIRKEKYLMTELEKFTKADNITEKTKIEKEISTFREIITHSSNHVPEDQEDQNKPLKDKEKNAQDRLVKHRLPYVERQITLLQNESFELEKQKPFTFKISQQKDRCRQLLDLLQQEQADLEKLK